jgi:hypothetical protein
MIVKDEFDVQFELEYKNDPLKIEKPLIRVLSLRECGNKLHGDTFELVLNRLINNYFQNMSSCHIGKIYFRSKTFDADIVISLEKDVLADEYAFVKNIINKIENSKIEKKLLIEAYEKYGKNNDIDNVINILKIKDHSELLSDMKILLKNMSLNIIEMSLKCYGEGPLQLYTDANHEIFPYLSTFIDDKKIETNLTKKQIDEIRNSAIFNKVKKKKVIVLNYSEKNNNFSLLTTNINNFLDQVYTITYYPTKGKNFEIFKFYDIESNYICEVRYGGPKANALQRGVWTNTKRNKNTFHRLVDNKNYIVDEKFLDDFVDQFFK